MKKHKILLIDDDDSIRMSLGSFLISKGYLCIEANSGAKGIDMMRQHSPDLVLLDMRLPDADGLDLLQKIKAENQFVVVIMVTGFGTIEKAVKALKLGAENFLTKPFDAEALLILIDHSLKVQSFRKQETLKELNKKYEDDHFIGQGTKMIRFYELAQLCSTDQITVLIQGETGTGKGKWAGWIHEHSEQSKRPFVELNCAGLSKELLESELFGYEKGAFTGAFNSKIGLLEIADGGTLFLDEISEMELAVQAKVLKVLDDKKFRRLGSTNERHVDVRLIAATNEHLQDAVSEGKFRADLFYRLNVMTLELPPLRERQGDVVPLSEFFLNQLAQRKSGQRPALTAEAAAALTTYAWPGNLRELRNVLERAFLLCRNGVIGPDLFPFQSAITILPGSRQDQPGGFFPLRDIELRYMRQVLESVDNNYRKAAEILGVNRNTLYNRLRKED